MARQRKEVRVRHIPDRYADGRWETKPQPITRMGEVGCWSMVRRSDYPGCAPFVISTREWDKLEVQEAAN